MDGIELRRFFPTDFVGLGLASASFLDNVGWNCIFSPADELSEEDRAYLRYLLREGDSGERPNQSRSCMRQHSRYPNPRSNGEHTISRGIEVHLGYVAP